MMLVPDKATDSAPTGYNLLKHKRSLRKLLDYDFDVLPRGDATHRLKSKHMDALIGPIESTPVPTPNEDQDNKTR